MKLHVFCKNKTVLSIVNAKIAKTFKDRLFGLMGRKSMGCGAMVFPNCKAIHTFFMRFPIDVIYINKDMNVIGIEKNLTPWKISKWHPKTYGIIELPIGILNAEPFCIKFEE